MAPQQRFNMTPGLMTAWVDAAVEAGCDAATDHTTAGDEIGTHDRSMR